MLAQAIVFALTWLGLATVALAQTAFPVQFPPPQGGAFCQGMDLCFDYTKGQGSPGLAFPPGTDTHSAVINAQSSTGGWQSFNANSPVITDLGIQTVPTRTNLLLRSQQFTNVQWIIGGVAIADNVAVAPDGATTAATITPDNMLRTHRVHQDYTSTAAVYAVSFFVKANGYSKVAIREDAVLGAYAAFDVSGSGSVLGTGGGGTPTGSISAQGNGWFRIVMTYTGTAATNRPTLYVMDNGYTTGSPAAYLYIGDGTSGVFVWQGQLELGAFASPPILTSGSAATVNGNQQVVDLTGRLASGVGGIVQINVLFPETANTPITFNNGISLGEALRLVYNNGVLQWQTRTGLGSYFGVDLAPASASTVTIAFASSENFLQARVVGQSQPTALTTEAYPSGLSKINIGGIGINSINTSYQLTRRLALRFGPQNATTFADLFAKAQILAAVSQ